MPLFGSDLCHWDEEEEFKREQKQSSETERVILCQRREQNGTCKGFVWILARTCSIQTVYTYMLVSF